MNKKQNEQQNLEGIKIKATKPKTLEDGKHEGKIGDLKFRQTTKNNETFEYVDIFVDVKTTNNEIIILKVGFPFFLSELSTFGRFLISSGFTFVEDVEYNLNDIKKHLLEKTVSFQTMLRDTPKGTFCNILRETIKFE